MTASASMGGPADFGGTSIAAVSKPVPLLLRVVVPLLYVCVARAGLYAAWNHAFAGIGSAPNV